ncbi:MAG: hypothetical protein U9Q76_00670 [candidate division WOR-3 bacterium]|nr:hypothetical protein [candidate division WOR-3 bacterium]
MFQNKNLKTLITALTIAVGLFAGSVLSAGEWDGDWYGEGEGYATWGVYTIHVFAAWEMNIVNGVVTGEWWEEGAAYGDIYGYVNDQTDYGSGTWDVDNPIGCPLHGTWEADYYTCEGGYCMDGSWYYYNLLGQKVRGGPIWGSSPRSGIPE